LKVVHHKRVDWPKNWLFLVKKESKQIAQKLAFSKFYGKIIRNDYIILRRDRMSVSFENKETNRGVL